MAVKVAIAPGEYQALLTLTVPEPETATVS
jgi:hypothetical protein